MKKKQQHGRRWALVGIPDHQGVLAVRGRLGAAQGPRAFRELFATFKGRDGVESALADYGDAPTLHSEAADFFARAHEEAGLSVLVGGGHDHGYTQLLGLRRSLKKNARIGCLNVDAHLDVRKPNPAITSGSPFFVALEEKVLDPKRLVEFGIQKHCNGPELWDYVQKKKVRVYPFETLRNGNAISKFKQALSLLARTCDQIVLSFDLDSVLQAAAPGVSAPQSEGFTPMEILEFMRIAGENRKVCSLGIFELNPIHDQDRRTARLAATAAYHFIASRINS